ncbi:Rossmann fold domain-containing protein [Amycolatopsis thermophila]
MQVLVPVGGPADVASGAAAGLLGDAFVTARDAVLRLEPGGAVLFRCEPGEDALVGAITSLCRTLAREAAPRGVRVNAIVAGPEADVDGLIAFLGSPAAAMCTGAVLEAV